MSARVEMRTADSARDVQSLSRKESLRDSAVCARHVPEPSSVAEDHPASSDAPLSERPAAGPSDVLSTLRASSRGPDGRFVPGNFGALKTGAHSDRLLEEPALAPFHRERCQAIEVDLGGREALSATQRPLVSELARVQLFTEALGENVMQHGALTGKGKTRAAVAVYLTLLDRQMKLAQLLGLSRISQPVHSTPATWRSAWLAQQEESRPNQQESQR